MEGDYRHPCQLVNTGISIHSLRMEGDLTLCRMPTLSLPISIHSLRMEGDIAFGVPEKSGLLFQSTPSAWRETTAFQKFLDFVFISIHSLRMEGDLHLAFMILLTKYFNPLPPHGGRPRNGPGCTRAENTFQSTPSAWRETYRKDGILTVEDVFQSTPSAWRETWRKLRG